MREREHTHTHTHTHTHIRLDDYYKKKYVVFYILICSLCGSLTVMCVKGVSTALILTLSGTIIIIFIFVYYVAR